MTAIKKAFDLLGDDIVELSKENETLKNETGDYDQNWLEESKQNFWNRPMTRKEQICLCWDWEKQMKKQSKNGFYILQQIMEEWIR